MDEALHAGRIGAESQEQESACKRDVLHEIPEHIASATLALQAKIRRFPELFPEQRRDDAIPRKDDGRETIRHARKDCR